VAFAIPERAIYWVVCNDQVVDQTLCSLPHTSLPLE